MGDSLTVRYRAVLAIRGDQDRTPRSSAIVELGAYVTVGHLVRDHVMSVEPRDVRTLRQRLVQDAP